MTPNEFKERWAEAERREVEICGWVSKILEANCDDPEWCDKYITACAQDRSIDEKQIERWRKLYGKAQQVANERQLREQPVREGATV